MTNFINKKNFAEIFCDNFLPSIPKKALKILRCYPPKHGFIWNACEYNLAPNKKGKAAMLAYDHADKTNAFMMKYDNGSRDYDDFSRPLTDEYDTSEKIWDWGLMEFYVFGNDFSWCYIVTHELSECGPYYILKPNPDELNQ